MAPRNPAAWVARAAPAMLVLEGEPVETASLEPEDVMEVTILEEPDSEDADEVIMEEVMEVMVSEVTVLEPEEAKENVSIQQLFNATSE